MSNEDKVGGFDNSADASIQLTSKIVAAYVGNNPVPAAELPSLIQTVHETIASISHSENEPPQENIAPAVSIKRSKTPDYLICLEDGKKFKSLKRHLRSKYNMSPDEYRAKWNLPADYPMVAPNYAKQRSELAKKMGLGQAKR